MPVPTEPDAARSPPTTVEEGRAHLRATAHQLADVAENVADVLDALAATRERVAETSRGDRAPLRATAERARTFACHERDEAERLRRRWSPTTEGRGPDR